MQLHLPNTCRFAFITLLGVLQASATLYEGFHMPTGSGKGRGATDKTPSGSNSCGWHSSWQVSNGKAEATGEDLSIPGLLSETGAVLIKGERKERAIGQGIAIRQINIGFEGHTYGSYRFRSGNLIQDSVLGLLLSIPSNEPISPRSATFAICPKRWGSSLGMLGAGKNKITKNQSGIESYPEETYLVLWKMENLPPIGKRSDIRVKMWVLNSQQAAYYARQGFNESVLDQAGEGNDPSQVSQAIETSVRNSKRGIFRGMLVSCFSVGVPRVCFDEIRLSQVSLDAAAGRIPTKN